MLVGLLEDDSAQSRMLMEWLENAGHKVLVAETAGAFMALYQDQALDLAILDWHLPDKSGIDVLRLLRVNYESKIPILFSTQRNSEEDIVTALHAGADDYLIKPVRQAELLARVSALGRRAGIADADDIIDIGPIRLDAGSESISLNGEAVKLTRKDYLVALCLFRNLGKVLSREYLLKEVWGIDSGLDTRTVDVHVSRVRRALKIGPEIGYSIKTIYMHGYRFEKIDD